jgi:hypothetical protein
MHVQRRWERWSGMNKIRNGMSARRLSGVRWRKSRFSGAHGNCVEIALVRTGAVAVRNSRHPDGPALIYTRDEMVAFLSTVKNGESAHRHT